MTEKMTTAKAQNFNWINLDSDTFGEDSKVYREYGIDEEVLNYALDKNERARVEYDDQLQMFILIYNVPKLQKNNNHYETVPLTFLVRGQNLVTISNQENGYLVETIKNLLMKRPDLSLYKFLFTILFIISDLYFPMVEEMNADRQLISNRLKEKTSKNNLLALSDLETGIVYLISAAKQNTVLLEQIKTNPIYRSLNAVEREQLDDSLIEAKQLVEMTELASEILHGISGTYNNILNNNLNDTMKILTVLSLLLTIPTIVTGFFGMNVPLPFEHDMSGWWLIILISLAGWFGFSFILRQILK